MRKNDNLLGSLLLLTLIFCMWEVIVFCRAANFGGVALFFAGLLSGHNFATFMKPWWPLGLDLVAIIGLHVVWLVLVLLVTRSVAKMLHLAAARTWQLGIIIWICSAAWILALNQLWFSTSIFVMATKHSLLLFYATVVICWLLTAILLPLTLFAMMPLAVWCWQKRLHFFSIAAVIVLPVAWVTQGSHKITTAHTTLPNVIIIGLDDIAPMHLKYFGYQHTKTPFLDNWLANSVTFTNAYTPLPRTITAWGSILTGQYPLHNGIRENYQNLTNINFHASLVRQLQQHGYFTLFATDEISDTSFANLGRDSGFAASVTPPVDLAHVVESFMNDFPLSNLVTKTFLGPLLFSANVGNRFSYHTYDPNAFNEMIISRLKQQGKQPLFLAAHFHLPHYPFMWAGSEWLANDQQVIPAYDRAIARADQQVSDFISDLRRLGLLEHAIVILLSDHGESFALAEDRMITRANYLQGAHSNADLFSVINNQCHSPTDICLPLGHGSDILSYTQYHNLLAIRLFGFPKTQTAAVSAPVSLVDLQPTIFDLLQFDPTKSDGESLTPYLFSQQQRIANSRMIFVESGYYLPALHALRPSMMQLMEEARTNFTFDVEKSVIILKPEALAEQLVKRPHGVYYRDWFLALFPTSNKFLPVLINRHSGKWSDDLTSALAQHSPAREMLYALLALYGKESSGLQLLQQ